MANIRPVEHRYRDGVEWGKFVETNRTIDILTILPVHGHTLLPCLVLPSWHVSQHGTH